MPAGIRDIDRQSDEYKKLSIDQKFDYERRFAIAETREKYEQYWNDTVPPEVYAPDSAEYKRLAEFVEKANQILYLYNAALSIDTTTATNDIHGDRKWTEFHISYSGNEYRPLSMGDLWKTNAIAHGADMRVVLDAILTSVQDLREGNAMKAIKRVFGPMHSPMDDVDWLWEHAAIFAPSYGLAE